MKTWIVFVVTLRMITLHVAAQETQDCTIGGIDLVFVLDESSSIGARGFQLIRQFAEEISRSLDIGPYRSRVGVILFGSSARVHFPVVQYTDAATLLPALNPGLPYKDGTTNTATTLDLLQTAGQPGGALGLRSQFEHIAIVVTDGKSNDQKASLSAANALHMSDIYSRVYAVGISEADATELSIIASNPSSVFFSGDFNSEAISAVGQRIIQQLPCEDYDKLSSLTATGDPHFSIPLFSNDTLCYSMQGYPGLTFNLIYSENFIINALFVDSIIDKMEATWIGKLAVIPQDTKKSHQAVILDSTKQEVILMNQGHFTASKISKISYDASGKMNVKFTLGSANHVGNPQVIIEYDKPFARFDVKFYHNHLDVNWDMKHHDGYKIHGLIGQLMMKGMEIDPIKKILVYPDNRNPVPVETDNAMTGKTCWKAMNPGRQGEGLIKGSILDYMVSSLLEDDFVLKKTM